VSEPAALADSSPAGAVLQQLRVLWAAFFASVAVCVAVGLVVAPPAGKAPDRHTPLMWVLALAAAVNLLTVVPVTRLVVDRARAGGPQARLAAHRTAFVVAAARVEAVAVLGLVVVLVSGRRDWFALFAGAAVLGMLMLLPRHADLEPLALDTERPAPPIEP